MSNQVRSKQHDKLQADAYQWAHNTFPQIRGHLFAVLNEIHPHPKESREAFMVRVMQCKAIGLRKGILDLHIDVPPTDYNSHGAPYEFDAKIKPDKFSKEQEERAALLRKCGGNGHEFSTLEQFKSIFIDIIRKHYGPII
jgi:hypothetical protein